MTFSTDLSPASIPSLAPATVRGEGPWKLFWERLRQDRVAMAALIVIGLMVVIAAVGGPLAASITGHPVNQPYTNTMLDEYGIPKGPTGSFLFGADSAGRDLFVRVMYGARTSLIVGIGASTIAIAFGVAVGVLAGFLGGGVDTLLSRLIDVTLSLPQILVAVGIVAAVGLSKDGAMWGLLQPGLPVVIAAIAFFSWAYIARVIRSIALSIREMPFVEAATAVGAGRRRIVVSEVLPNLAGPIIVYWTLLIPTSILFEAALDYLGLGVPTTTASWGATLAEGNSLYNVAWWIIVCPGVFLLLTTLAFNLLGDGLRDALDIRTER